MQIVFTIYLFYCCSIPFIQSPSDAHSAWAPRVDGYYIIDSPENLLASGQFYKVDLLSGTVPDECAGEYRKWAHWYLTLILNVEVRNPIDLFLA